MGKKIQYSGRMKVWHAVSTFVFCCALVSFGKTSVPVFLLSGQSNMTGYFASVNDLSADQKKPVDNVKIYMDGDGDNAKKKKWLTLEPGFGAFSSNLGPELSLGRTLSDSMPGVKIAFIKDAVGGTYLAKSEGWLPPSSNGGTGGTLYKNMMTAIDAALKSFSTAYDTTQYTPRWAGFVWFQGEFDAYDMGYSKAYESNLTNLIKDIRAKTNTPDLPVILPMIDVQTQWTNNGIVRAADVAVSQKLENVDTMDTKGFPTDGTHYKAAGYIKIGQICAQRWTAMKFVYEDKVPAIHHYFQQYAVPNSQSFSYSVVNMYDLLGKQIRSSGTDMSRNLQTHTTHNTGIVIQQIRQSGSDDCNNTHYYYRSGISNLKNR